MMNWLILATIGIVGFYSPQEVYVEVGDWDPFYTKTEVPSNYDYQIDDPILISVFTISPEGVRSPKGLITDFTYLRIQSAPLSGLEDNWMGVGVFPGYVGLDSGTYVWEAINTRTGEDWDILILHQRATGVSARPLPPSQLK